MKTRKTTTRGICFVLALMLFCLFVIGCGQTHDDNSESSNESSGDESSTNSPVESNSNNSSTNSPVESNSNNSLLSDFDIKSGVAELYNLTEYSSVVSVEKIRVLGTYHVEVSGGSFESVVLECKVLTDFYDKIQNGATIFVPIPVETTVETTLNLIDTYDYFIFYLERLYDEADVTNSDTTKSVLNNVSSYARMSMHMIIPVKNEVIKTDSIYTLLDNASVPYLPIDEIAGYEDFITDGINLDTVETRFRYLKRMLEADDSATNPEQKNEDDYD